MASRRNGTLYLGVTSNVIRRVFEHRSKQDHGFAQNYGCTRLVWYAATDDIQVARARELQMKKWKRAWKLEAIEAIKPDWADLYDEITR